MAGVGAFVPGGQYNQFNTSADQYRLNDLPPDIAVEEQALNRRQQIANLLMSHATQPIQTGQMAGRFFVPPSWAQGANQLGQALAGTYLTNVNDESRQNLSQQNQQQTAQAIQDYIQKTSPQRVTTPAQTTTTELEGPGAPVPTGIQPGEGFTPEQLAQPTANYSSLKDALASLHDKRSKAFFQEGERPTSTTTIPGTTTMVPPTTEAVQQADLSALTSNVKGLQSYAQSRMQQQAAAQEHALQREATHQENEANRKNQLVIATGKVDELMAMGLITQAIGKQMKEALITSNEKMNAATNASREEVAQIAADAKLAAAELKAKEKTEKPMSATVQHELFKTDAAVLGIKQGLDLTQQALDINDKAMGFTGAGVVASAGTLIPEAMRPETIDATNTLDNLIQGSLLPQLKDAFGGNPTEGERKVLFDVGGSSNKSPSVRKGIFDRAKTALAARLEFNQTKAAQIRKGTYFSEQGGTPTSSAPGTPTPTEGQVLKFDAQGNQLP